MKRVFPRSFFPLSYPCEVALAIKGSETTQARVGDPRDISIEMFLLQIVNITKKGTLGKFVLGDKV